MESNRQKSEAWLDLISKCRISCHEITWHKEDKFNFMKMGGDLYYHQIPNIGTTIHCHDFSEIILVNTGSLIHYVNGERQLLTAGNLVFMRPDDMHCFMPNAGRERAEVVLLDFDLELFLSLSIYLENDSFLQQLTASVLPPVFMLDPNDTNELYNRLLKLNSNNLTPQVRKIKLKILLGELYSHYFIDGINILGEATIPEWLSKLCTIMRRKENFVLGINHMQKLACKTPGHLCKSFQRYLNKTPTDYINELKITHAAELLRDTTEDIIIIADRLNFQSVSRFYSLFKKQYHISPAAYRKLHTISRDI